MVRSNSIQPDPTKKKQPWQGALSKKKVGGSEGSPLQEVDYTYNIRGWLTSVNQPQNLGKDLFGFELKYQNPVSNGKDTPKYNGNNSQMDWKTRSNNEELRRYTYQYDDLSRLTKSFYSKPLAVQPNTGSYDEYLSYDVNGNIKTLSRFGDMDKPQAVKIDELSYTYIGNQLVKVSDNSQNPSGYPIGGGVIPYDENGNMMNHKDKGISYIGYNHLNLPSAVFWNGKQTFYLYRADGVKVKKDFPGKVTDYLDGFQYENGALQFVPTAEGYYDFVKQRYVYNYTDHLGNIRLSYYKGTGGLIVDKESNYYPFGLEHKGYNNSVGNSAYRYSYQGQERQEDTNWLTFKWRNYDPTIGRFFGVDILADRYQYQTPYAFSENKVINYVEWEGLEAVAPPLPVGPVPPLLPPPIYGNTETGLHPAGVQPLPTPTLNDIKEVFNRGINTLKVFITIKAVEIEQGFNNIKEGFDAIKDTWSRVLNSDGSSNSEEKGKYGHLKEPKNVGEGLKTTPAQRKRILEENKRQNNGQLTSDGDGRPLNMPKRNLKGEKADMNQAEVDHVKARSKGGSNSNHNLRVISKEENLKKSNK